MIKSISLLVLKPGFLTKEYLRGVRVKYVKPLQLFVLINFVYFFILNFVGYELFTTDLKSFTESPIYGSFAKSMVEEKLQKSSMTLAKYEDEFYDKIYVESKLIIILMIPMLALWFKLVYREKNSLYFDHLVYSTYFFTFLLLLSTFLNLSAYAIDFIFAPLMNLLNLTIEIILGDVVESILITLVIAVYLYAALKRMYRQPVSTTIFKTILSIVGLFLTTEIYKFILFLTVYYIT